MWHPIKAVVLGILLAMTARATEAVEAPPGKSSALSLESGVLWEVGTGTPFAYRLLQTQLSWRSGEFMGWQLHDGSRLVVRHRVTLLGTAMHGGPESHYFGIAGSPSLEWWNRAATWSFFSGAGGGFGLTDSQRVKGGLGQDFTLNWFARGGVEHVVARKSHLSVAIVFQHMSNGGMTKPNPGIDALGFMIGWSWTR